MPYREPTLTAPQGPGIKELISQYWERFQTTSFYRHLNRNFVSYFISLVVIGMCTFMVVGANRASAKCRLEGPQNLHQWQQTVYPGRSDVRTVFVDARHLNVDVYVGDNAPFQIECGCQHSEACHHVHH